MYEEMADMFLKNPRLSGWKRDNVVWWLMALDKRNQLVKVERGGKVKLFIAWVYMCREDFGKMAKNTLKVITNIGDCVCPLFVATDGTVSRATMRRMAKEIRRVAPILSFRKGRTLEIGVRNG